MSILKIARLGHPILQKIASPVDNFKDPEIKKIINDMIDTLDDAGGIGLAAPQIHVSKRIVIFFVPEDRLENGKNKVELTIMINPKIEPKNDMMNRDWEACLSIPNLMGAVDRYSHIKYSWYDVDGEYFEREASGYHSRVVQHECDHLDGKLYPFQMLDLSLLGFQEEINSNKDLLDKGRSLPSEI
ncbi:MAG: peptide deformylase [Rhodospirillaceae bacterium]|mgnify:CR=1 FL=1|nr:peptide deformylase [Rhodospirillaceae bacterium]OUT78246.1 MAG: peptide deformylase [Rhodospirillaceae bacterium TMED23]|tara:strand:- start:814 stop:1371 length:558 start_codon:yes stop_codon:yes gene_type:complete